MFQQANAKFIIGAVIVALVAALGYIFYSGDNSGEEGANNTIAKLEENSMGNADAPITIIEYSSLTCPHCALFHKDTLPALKSKYIETGKVKYQLREFPLDTLATAGFMLGRCLEKRSAYFDFIDTLYATQAEWTGAEDQVGALKIIAKQVGFNDESFKTCIDDKNLFAQILAVKNAGLKDFRVRSTPTFFINGTRLEGAQSLEEFEKLMKPLLGDK